MPSWNNTDVALSAPLQKLNIRGATVRTARGQFGNTTSIGVFAANAAEVAANRNVAHQGWQLRQTLSGPDGPRERFETLVAMRIVGADALDDAILPDA
ncbi:MAG: hypothetical protein DDT26_00304 [Dehalococcoidia bacterium]|nr:hypothetical protein [Chloroflexota bacterium]